jgi:hypothetical protein
MEHFLSIAAICIVLNEMYEKHRKFDDVEKRDNGFEINVPSKICSTTERRKKKEEQGKF